MGMTLLDSWTQHWDPSSENFFYYNGRTGLTTWDPTHPLQKDNNRPLSRDRIRHKTAIPSAGNNQHVPETWSSQSRENLDTRRRDMKRSSHDRSTDECSANRGGNRKSTTTDCRNEEPRKDYITFAREYSATAPYRDTRGTQTCVICQRRRASGVFFPCEHKCVCTRCIESEGFGNNAASDAASVCPVCCQHVVFVVPFKDGHEADKYWRWVHEVKPPLPRGFQDKFHMAAILLKIKSEPDSHKTWDRPDGCCILS